MSVERGAALSGVDDPWDRVLLDAGYVLCRPCEEWHRPPECCVDGEGRALARCGCPWEVVETIGCWCAEISGG